jgi:acyl carrier protein
MTREEAAVVVCDIVRDVLDCGEAEVSERSGPGSPPAWDSVAQVAILAAVEVRTGITIAAREAERLTSLGDLVALLAGKSETALV